MEDFIREQIKDKPLNKKNVLKRLGISALCGLVFALVAGTVLLLMLGTLDNNEGDMVASNTEGVEAVTEMTTETETTEEEIVIPDMELSIEDYQELQTELYSIGIKANKSIVTITGVTNDKDWFNNNYESVEHGAGVIISETSKELLILTERRVISDASKVKVTFINDEVAEASLKQYDGTTGIAIVSVKKSEIDKQTLGAIEIATIGNSNRVRRGMITIALGNPLGANYSILAGNITSCDNDINTTDNNYSIFTTDIVSNKNGSGVLINTDGEVIGIIMQEYSAIGSENTITALAISDVEDLLDLLLAGNDVPYLGCYVNTVTDRISNAHNIPKGVYVKNVAVDSPAMAGGIQIGDVIVELDGKQVSTASAYSNVLKDLKVDSVCKVKVKRKSNDGYKDITCEIQVGVLK